MVQNMVNRTNPHLVNEITACAEFESLNLKKKISTCFPKKPTTNAKLPKQLGKCFQRPYRKGQHIHNFTLYLRF
uniref:Uncharacterized protein n=1 Tax=Rhizophora mucronata TaxID=61149 RepID=A0A2P2MZA2_RHIMU